MGEDRYVRWFDEVTSEDVAEVGGKNASLGDMISSLKDMGISVPGGFATTAKAYRKFIEKNDLEGRIRDLLSGAESPEKAGRKIRSLFIGSRIPEEIEREILDAYEKLSQANEEDTDVAVRSSATAEDLPEASFAGQQETYLNVRGESELLEAVRKCFASLFTDRAITYREENGFDHIKVALSVGVQKMVRSDLGGSGVLFTVDTETGFPDVVVINAAFGLGENVVQGSVNPDEYVVFKPLLKEGKRPIVGKDLGSKEKKMVYSRDGKERTRNVETGERERSSFVLDDDEILKLSEWAVKIEEHFGRPMDIEWAKDGRTGELKILQARPETVQSGKDVSTLRTFHLKEKGHVLVEGVSVGERISSGKVQVMKSAEEISSFEEGSVLVTGMTDPDWVPIMKKAAAIVTDHGGRTSHAAIVSREFDITAVVGCGNATDELEEGQTVTVSCAEGETGRIYQGELEFETRELDPLKLPSVETSVMMNMASPASSFRWWRVPTDGIGLARMEFVINNVVGIHPMALVRTEKVEDRSVRKEIERRTRGYDKMTDLFVDSIARGAARMAASCYPRKVIMRMSDLKTNEYADLIGGRGFEPEESNPMLGFRGASRYYSEHYKEAFALECRALKKAREEMGFENIAVMIPFCRTLEEADRVLELLKDNGLERGMNGLEIFIMAEIPSNIILAEEYASRFDGFSIGSNDLTQLVLGVDRDSELLSHVFDESDPAVKKMISLLIERAHRSGAKVSFCGQAPSDDPDYAGFLVGQNIDSISVNPDSLASVIEAVSRAEKERS